MKGPGDLWDGPEFDDDEDEEIVERPDDEDDDWDDVGYWNDHGFFVFFGDRY